LIFVLIFTMVTLIAGIYVAYITQINLKRRAQRQALAMFPERNPSPVMNLNWQGQILFANPACSELLQRLNMDINRTEELLPANFYRNLKRWQNDRKTLECFESEIKGRQLAYNLSLLPDLGSCHLYIEDITERKQAEEQLHYQAYHDIHTGLANRRQFELDLGLIIEQKLPISVMFIAIDRFKFITASQGYFIGDQIIKEFGRRLVHECEQLDFEALSYRLDGSTFCVLVNSPKSQHAWDTSHAIQNSMDAPLQVGEHRYYLTLSMGFCHFPENGRDAKALITNGNAALNSAKLKGDNIAQYSEQHHAQEQSWLPIEEKIRKALEWDQFELHYQAKVDGQDHSIKGAEALIRLKDENGNHISPGRFIPVAEQTGLIIKIGQWVIEKGFRQAKAWDDQGDKIKLAINISARQFQDRNFLIHLQQQLSETQVNPALIELEITESLLMDNAEQSIFIMKQLKAMGFALAIDDFGTGYSSLAYLKRFPIDTLKVDQAFVRNLETDKDDQNIVRAIVSLGQHLNLEIVAEGVETSGQLSFLNTLNVNYIQGFLFSKPDVAEKLFES
ncbi:sensor domain-containing protein, partial [Bermanella marisrubri]